MRRNAKFVAQQGNLDGFCGLYCAAHIIAGSNGEDSERVTSIFYAILRVVEEQNLLTAKHIAGPDCGYTDLQIAKFVNSLSTKSSSNMAAIAFRKGKFKLSAFFQNANVALQSGAKFIIQDDGGNHWIAVNGLGTDGRYACYDPYYPGGQRSRERMRWDQGVMIAPHSLIEEL